jgi:hypothetical protein
MRALSVDVSLPTAKMHSAFNDKPTRTKITGSQALASLPFRQFEYQVNQIKQNLKGDRILRGRDDRIANQASKDVERSWRKQGIWNDEWNHGPGRTDRWKHELIDTCDKLQQQAQRKKPNKISQDSLDRDREDQASRPIGQFLSQVSEERKKLQALLQTTDKMSPKINSDAYEAIKKGWVKQGIWNEEWGVLPGMAWMHEEISLESTHPSTTSSGIPTEEDIMKHPETSRLEQTRVCPSDPGAIARMEISTKSSEQPESPCSTDDSTQKPELSPDHSTIGIPIRRKYHQKKKYS